MLSEADVLELRLGDRVSDERRFRALFDEHYRAIARYFLARGHDAADADDLVAATFEVAWHQLDAVPAGDETILWLYGAARDQLRNARRKRQREAALVNDVGYARAAVTESPFEDRAVAAETMRALARLGSRDRELILLVTWDEMTPAEAGRVLGLRPSAARTRLNRARRRLADLLEVKQNGGIA